MATSLILCDHYPVIELVLRSQPNSQNDIQSREYSLRVGSFVSEWRLSLNPLQNVVELTKMNGGEVNVGNILLKVTKRDGPEVEVNATSRVLGKGQSVSFQVLQLDNVLSIKCQFVLLRKIGNYSCSETLLKNLFMTKEHSDLEICTLDGVTKAHKAIIGAISPLLKYRIDNCGIEYGAAQIDMMEFSDDIQQMIIRYAYGELTLPEIKEHSVKLFQAAYIYQMKDLECLCELCLPEITVDNVVKICAAAFFCKNTKIFVECCKIMMKNYVEVKKQDAWKEVIRRNISLLDVITDGLMNVSFVNLGEEKDRVLHMPGFNISARSNSDVYLYLCSSDVLESKTVKNQTFLELKSQPEKMCPSVKELIENSISEIYQQEMYTDCYIQTKTTKFKAHEFILKHHSDLLVQKISSDKILSIHDTDMATALLDIMYLGCTKVNFEKVGTKVLEFGQKYEIPAVLTYCCENMAYALTPHNVCTVHNLAFLYEMSLLENTTEYIKQHYKEIKLTNSISDVLYENKGAMLYVVERMFEKIESDEESKAELEIKVKKFEHLQKECVDLKKKVQDFENIQREKIVLEGKLQDYERLHGETSRVVESDGLRSDSDSHFPEIQLQLPTLTPQMLLFHMTRTPDSESATLEASVGKVMGRGRGSRVSTRP